MSPRSTFTGTRPAPLRTAIAALAVAAVGLLSACGSEPAAPTTPNTDGTVDITVLRSTGSTFEPLYIAEQQGYFKEAGLNVTIKAGAADTSQNAPSIVNGEAQFAMTDSSGFLKAAAQKLPVRIVSGLQSSTTKTAPSDGLLVKPDSPIKSFADVGGKTIGLAALGGTLQFITQYSAKQAGVDPKSIKFVALPVASLNDAVTSGQIDGAYTFATFLEAGKAAGLRAVGAGTNALPGLVQSLLFASVSYLQNNAATAKKFIDAVAKATDYATKNPDAVKAVDKQYTQLSDDYLSHRPSLIFTPALNTVVMRTVISGMKEYGIITAEPSDSDLYWEQAPTTTTSA